MENKTFYIRRGSAYRPTNTENIVVVDKLPAGNYLIKFDEMDHVFYLDPVEDFALPAKVYGSINALTERIITTFNSRPNSTGVLLTGEKGSGKSLLAKVLANECAKRYSLPTLLINDAHHGDAFNAFIQSISQPAIVLFDEFEKVYDTDEQDSMLTLLDGVFPTKKLFVLTCNDSYRINSHMLNRPGRIFYALNFDSLSEDDVRCYCSEMLNDKNQIESVVRYSKFFKAFSFDMLKSLVEEMNRYKETVAQAHKLLNAQPGSEVGDAILFQMHLFSPRGKKLTMEGNDIYTGAPFIGRNRCDTAIEVYYNAGTKKRRNVVEADFLESDAIPKRCVNGMYVYKNKDGYTLELHPKKPTVIDYSLLV